MFVDRFPQAERDHTSPESFVPLPMMENVIGAVLYENGRVDSNGVLQPLEIERKQHDPSKWILGMGPKLPSIYTNDVVPPPQLVQKRGQISEEDGMIIRSRAHWDPQGALYNTLTHRRRINLDEPDIQGLRTDYQNLNKALGQAGTYTVSSGDQMTDALHIKLKQPQTPAFEPLRIYIAAGTHAMGLARDMINLNAVFDRVKVWTPEPTTSPQVFRSDTPIFEVNNFTQLRSTVSALRALQSIGRMPIPDRPQPLLGITIPGLPGVYAGQTGRSSFNGEMGELFGDAIYRACLDTPMPNDGKSLDSVWLREAAIKGRAYAQENAAVMGRDPHNHAFVRGQPVAQIMSLLVK